MGKTLSKKLEDLILDLEDVWSVSKDNAVTLGEEDFDLLTEVLRKLREVEKNG